MQVTAGADNAAMRPQFSASRLVAEALVEGHEPTRIVARARQLGLSQDLTKAVVVACCGKDDVPPELSSLASHRDTPSAD